ncbi:MAG: hypothetical protein ACQER3_25120, partial [Pseudomonadota bacterium]
LILMKPNLEAISIGGLTSMLIWSYIRPKLDEFSKPYMQAYIEYKINPQKSDYWKLVNEHKLQRTNPNYLEEFAKRLVESTKSQTL